MRNVLSVSGAASMNDPKGRCVGHPSHSLPPRYDVFTQPGRYLPRSECPPMSALASRLPETCHSALGHSRTSCRPAWKVRKRLAAAVRVGSTATATLGGLLTFDDIDRLARHCDIPDRCDRVGRGCTTTLVSYAPAEQTTREAPDAMKVLIFTVRLSRVGGPHRSFGAGPAMRISAHPMRPRPGPARRARRRSQADHGRALSPAAPGSRMAVQGATAATSSYSGRWPRGPRVPRRLP